MRPETPNGINQDCDLPSTKGCPEPRGRLVHRSAERATIRKAADQQACTHARTHRCSRREHHLSGGNLKLARAYIQPSRSGPADVAGARTRTRARKELVTRQFLWHWCRLGRVGWGLFLQGGKRCLGDGPGTDADVNVDLPLIHPDVLCRNTRAHTYPQQSTRTYFNQRGNIEAMRNVKPYRKKKEEKKRREKARWRGGS